MQVKSGVIAPVEISTSSARANIIRKTVLDENNGIGGLLLKDVVRVWVEQRETNHFFGRSMLDAKGN